MSFAYPVDFCLPTSSDFIQPRAGLSTPEGSLCPEIRGQRKCQQGRDGAASETALQLAGLPPLPPHSCCTLIFPEWRWPLWLGTATSPAWNALPPSLPHPADSYPPIRTLLRCAIWCGSLSPKLLSGYPCISGPSTGPATVKGSACVC